MTSDEPPEGADSGEQEGKTAPDSFEALLRSIARTPRVLLPGSSLAGRRFEIVRVLGEGGMGVVYEAIDAARGGRVALKTLTLCGPQGIYRLKNEFRSLADVVHPNLVALHEFVRDGDVWFFTMDLLTGKDFLAYVSGDEAIELARTRGPSDSLFDETRLRDALRQLVQGVVALHQAGKLHCDLKPGNVSISNTGHLTILDFGLVSERAGPSNGKTLGHEFAGTPGYMAPEQMDGGELLPATDYYAIGVMLYESMTGGLPFRSTNGGVLRRSRHDPPPLLASHLTSGSTADLAELCLDLLRFDASLRPSEASLLARACRSARPSVRPSVPRVTAGASFVGRDAPLEQLLALRAGLAPSQPEAVLIRGPSGIGKTRLAQEFLLRCRDHTDSLVLEGRCYERESVPYNAFDSLIDALSRYLRRLPEVRAATLMPRDARVLAELFPVLRRVGPIESMPAPRLPNEPSILRRRAFDALKELLSRISDVVSIVVCIDDIQWADADSLQLLGAVLAEPAAPRLLLVGLHLDEHQGSAPVITMLCERHGVRLHEIVLTPLAEDASLQLIEEKLSLPEAEAQRMARDGNGNPFFLGELIEAHSGVRSTKSDLHQVILERAARLSPSMRALLGLLCVAGAPIDLGVGLQAVGLAEQSNAIVTELRNERWLRLGPTGKTQRVEIYHDRIRNVLFGALGDEPRRNLYQRLAECLETAQVVDEEMVASYWLKAGAVERAATGFARAARLAEKNLAFVSAGRLYGLALEHGRFDREEGHRLLLGKAAALERAGYAVAAALAYLEAANTGGQIGDALTLRRNAAQLLLASGSLEAGTEVLRRVLSEVGLDYPEEPEQALAWLEAAREELRARGLTAGAPRTGEDVDDAGLRKADACWAAGSTLGPYDFVRAGYFGTRGLCLALDTGDPLRIVRALAMCATSVASAGDTLVARQLAERSLSLASRTGDAIASANAQLAMGQVSLFAGDFAECLEASDRALAMFRNASAGASHEVHICNMFANMALHMSGRLDELVMRSREQLTEARECGHVQAEASLRVLGVALGHLANDEIALARKQGEISAALWPQVQLHGERFKVLRLEVWCDIFEGLHAHAWNRFAEARRQAGESLLLSSRYWSFWWYDLAAGAALHAAARAEPGPARTAFLAEAESAMTKLEGMEPKYVGSQSSLHRTARAHLVGDAAGTLDGLRSLCSVSHPILAACAQAQLGTLLGGPEGAALSNLGVLALKRWVKSPERWVAFMLPGFDAPPSPASVDPVAHR